MADSTNPDDSARPPVIKRLPPQVNEAEDASEPLDFRRFPEPIAQGRYVGVMRVVALLGVAVVLLLWLEGTPPGLGGKARAVGYAICHQIEVRTFVAGDVVMPLCARCTGTYLGVIVGFLGPALMRRGRAARMPSRGVTTVLLLFSLAWLVDGGNSYLHLFPNAPGIYEPHNALRLLTGSLQGLTMASFIYPVFNQSVWRRPRPVRSLRHLGDLAVLVIAALLLDLLVLLREPLLLAAMGWLSTAGVLVILTAIQTVVVVYMTRRPNQADDWRALVVPLIVGFGLAMVMIGAVDAARYSLFGTWEGMTIGQQ
jgi:uncharacterized membrane protein